ncbi:MAG TPA: c-type cytochrome biogenesis protein CcsB [Candidatus Dormibacteraeota bacterium]|nr:c-type cytochrome biogenesis protein CcsB [Candidatus Dormibacteraeota bacterium]
MHAMALDAVLMVLALSSYAVGALALVVYFFSREGWLRNFGATLAVTGCAAQFAQLGARYAETHIWPLLNLYGSLSLFSAMSVAIFIAFAFRYRLWFAGGFVLALAAIFLAYGVTWNEGVMPAVPSLQSYWAKIHVPLVVSSYAAFLVSFVFSILYLVKYYANRHYARRSTTFAAAAAGGGAALLTSFAVDTPAATLSPALRDTPALAAAAEHGDTVAEWFSTLPSLAQLDVLVYRAVAVGLPLLTLGVITGAAWAHEAWGAYWQWDPKETAALASWILYAAYMHLHTRHAWRGLRCSWWSVIGFASIIFCYLGVNIWISGLHSYKM